MTVRILVLALIVTAAVAVWAYARPPARSSRPLVAVVPGDLTPSKLRALARLEQAAAPLGQVDGPAEFLRAAAGRARAAVRREHRGDALVRLGLSRRPSTADRAFVDTVVLGAGTEPRPRLRWLFPDAAHARVVVRPRRALDSSERARAARRLAAAARGAGVRARVVADPPADWRLRPACRRDLLCTPASQLAAP